MLLPEDKAYLERKGYTYELAGEAGETLLVIKDYAFGPSYAPSKADILIRMLPGYPEATLDSFCSWPEVTLKATSRRPPNTDSIENHLGKQWQSWSRHLNAWRGGIDNLETFMTAVLKEVQQ